ncbi:uncharacterized protein PFL1_04069 [Pseudozyma flocculosa PF-1]|uniref:Mitochondrial distribution and morphology protein 10 n=2 Tax=Pseudozyma flocculosa TaxID=84751 RepID=A0A5C3EW95_9BASI|nr:uncharacterized protein PFL1_04069 [Pseudozyma flocculosa PF-1]EPQ28242.1 hypothetical protein PFL1_04069 [Pseudozyma flocculosa PF-1]SPO35381.1 related to Mitochondrial distribution and morphology protein 10 [Pseudozyma flocculosa]
MYDFVSHILRRYFEATGWNEHNSYLNLTASSSALLDFTIPSGLSLSISAAPASSFFTSYRLAALPNLRGGVGYIYSSTDTPLDIGSSSRDVNFKQIVERFRITEAPRRPQPKEPTWLAGERIDQRRDYLVYGCMHLPSSRLDALYTLRISPTWQLLVTAVSTPPKYPLDAIASSLSTSATALAASGSSSSGFGAKGGSLGDSNPNLVASGGAGAGHQASSSSSAAVQAANAAAASSSSLGAGPPGSTNLQLTLQNDTGRWFTEYSYSADDALWGFRVLHNFGTPSSSSSSPADDATAAAAAAAAITTDDASDLSSRPAMYAPTGAKARINESGLPSDSSLSEPDQVVGGGLRGRFSAGAEVFVSTVEKSAGISTGIRFATLPEPPSSSSSTSGSGAPSQPPTVLTATLNPMMGHLSTAYAAKMTRDLAVCSRFDFNVYSYDSELSIGGEYWLRASAAAAAGAAAATQPAPYSMSSPPSLRSSPPGARPTTLESGAVTAAGGAAPRDLRPSARANEAIAEAALRSSHLASESPSLHSDAASTSVPSSAPPMKPTSSYSLRDPAPALDMPVTALPESTSAAIPPAAFSPAPMPTATTSNALQSADPSASDVLPPITGVLKARISTAADIRLLWQARLKNCLVSLGVRADLDGAGLGAASSKTSAAVGGPRSTTTTTTGGGGGIVKSVGIEVMYFS